MQSDRSGNGAAGLGRIVAVVAVAGALAVAAGGVATAGLLAQSEAQLVDRLAEIERQLPPLPPDAVVVDETAPWGELTGNYRGASVQLDEFAGPLQSLFEDAEDADGAEAAAVAAAARGLLELHESYEVLARWEEADLEFPLDATDDRDVATGADPRYGLAEAGLRLVLEANERRLPAYRTLADSAAVDDDQRQLFTSRVDTLEAFRVDVRPGIKRLLSLPTTQQVTPVERFGTRAPGVEARARSFTFVCVPRDAVETTGPDTDSPPGPEDLRDVARTLPGDVTAAPDCTELADANTVQLMEP